MRLAHVSAHFPPDFVSGGTLVPQRLAAGLAERGHDVHVFAGHLGGDRPALSTWDEVHDGVPVRWVQIHPFTPWSNPLNVDNPAVTGAFRTWLREVRPDVVHVHSLQGVGSGVLPAAKAAGARVVVTMHDFWWVCARQFLVPPSMRPCSLVVDCGVCPCDVNHEWLEQRDALLRDRLASADLVLAPSHAAARVLAANGLAPDRLEVDENGLPEQPEPPAREARAPGAPVRFLYAGGQAEVKGWPTLLSAVQRLADLPGWTLAAHGVDPAPEADGLPVQALPPYRPDELRDVLAAADVLVLPSLARESHSILVREALIAGLVVVCSDVPGPLEVVRHGVNGLVVPAGDDLVLADALASLVRDPELLTTLTARSEPVRVRPLQEQVADLEERYARLLSDEPRDHPSPAVRRVLFAVGIEGAPLRYRVRLAAEALAEVGVASDVRHYRDVEVPALAMQADAVVLYRVPASDQLLELVRQVKERPEPVPLLFDVDDLIFDEELRPEVRGLERLSASDQDLYWEGVRRYRTTLEACDLYVGSTDGLVQHAEAVAGIPGRRWANGVGRLLAQASDAALTLERRPGPVRLGYFSGTTTHDHDWAAVESAVVEVMRRHPDVELWLGGHLNPTGALAEVADRVHRLPFVPWYELPELLHQVDVNLAPLQLGGRFNEAKSAIKWLEAALVATVTVASPSQPFREAVRDGENGALADGHDAWVEALDRLVTDLPLRRRLGERARQDVLLEGSPHLQGQRYLAILQEAREQVSRHGHRPARPGAVVETRDEPWVPHPLEPYASGVALPVGPPSPPALPVRLLRALLRLLGRGVAVTREQGPVEAAARTGRTVRRLAPRVVKALRLRLALLKGHLTR